MAAYEEFRNSLTGESPPEGSSPALDAMWWAAKGDWDRAHLIAGALQEDADCNLVHAHLHRAEGDLESAAHWYEQSGHAVCSLPLDQEWQAIAGSLLERSAANGRGG